RVIPQVVEEPVQPAFLAEMIREFPVIRHSVLIVLQSLGVTQIDSSGASAGERIGTGKHSTVEKRANFGVVRGPIELNPSTPLLEMRRRQRTSVNADAVQ